MNKQDKYRAELQNRSIQPSEGSWEQLNAQLNAHEKLQKNQKWNFVKYAAAILLIAAVGFYFFQPKAEIISEEKIENPASNKKIENEPIINSKKEIFMAEVEAISTPIQTKKENIQPEFKQVEEVVVLENNVAESTSILNENEIETKTTTNTVANTEVTDAEIEQLLKNAKIKVNLQNLTQESVSAQALLVEVEDDLNKDFKDKLLQTIVTTLKTPREITISDRGN